MKSKDGRRQDPGEAQPRNFLGGKNWQAVFQRRKAWELSPSYLKVWKAQNKHFYECLRHFVPNAGARVLELGCGPGRHAISMALMGYRVLGVDLDSRVLEQAAWNAKEIAPDCRLGFQQCNVRKIGSLFPKDSFNAVTHGGMMEHFESIETIRSSLRDQLQIAPFILFDVPVLTRKNSELFAKDDIFRHEWRCEYWIDEVLRDFVILSWKLEIHNRAGMTDDLVCVLGRSDDQTVNN